MPGEFKTLVKPSHENMKDFNRRLREVCDSAPITSFKVVVVDGQPVITLISEVEEATEEDVADAKEDGETLELDELIPVGDVIKVQISGISAVGESAAATELAHDTLNKRVEGDVIGVEYFSGPFVRWEPDYNDILAKVDKPRQVLVQTTATYAAIISLQAPVEAESKK